MLCSRHFISVFVIFLTLSQFSSPAQALLSYSCSEIDGSSDTETSVTAAISTSDPISLSAGEQVIMNWQMNEIGGANTRIRFTVTDISAGTAPRPINIYNLAAYGTVNPVIMFTAPSDSIYVLAYEILDNVGITTLNNAISSSCKFVGLAQQDHQDAAQSASQISNIQQQQTSNLLLTRIRQISQNSPRRQSPTITPPDFGPAINPEFRFETNGQNAGDSEARHGFWGNLAITHNQDHHQSSDYTSLQGSAVIGIDTYLDDMWLIGSAINLEYARLSRQNNQMEMNSSGIGISPYLTYQLDDVFSISSLANITYSHNHSGFNNGTKIDQDSIRWNIAVQGDGFWSRDNWGLLAGIGLSYGQTHLLETKDNNGTDVTGQTTRLGTAQLTLQPSYYWQYDHDLSLEPYLLAQYNYDYSMTKISTSTTEPHHPNDQDSFRLGFGLNLFNSSNISGNIEASTVLGRDNYSETSLTGNIRIQF